ncbi:hypothetical protein [Streptomyces sp. NPDC048256]|uniref:hypothetical protein n=1 Tax=Streptomyces sp. NPDC048256 TaxID=3154613 RepID=UPI0033E7A538
MATPTELGRTRYEQVTSTVRAVVELVQRLWKGMSPSTIEDDLEGPAGAAIVEAVAEGQLSVADAAQAYIAAQMAAQGGSAAAEAALVAAAFAGIAPDGGPLETLLFLPAIGVRRRLAAGLAPDEAMLGGLADMARYASTAVTDAARSSDQVGMAANRGCVAYVRVVQLPACSRCIVLSGQMYRYSEGFLRHPNCDCQTLPLREHEWPDVPTPKQLAARMSEAEQRRVFTVAGADAIRAGADVGQVVNARRGMSRPGAPTTAEGITRRGLYGRQMRRAGGEFARYPGRRYSQSTTPRLTPDAIFRRASSRGEQLELLRRYGYIV